MSDDDSIEDVWDVVSDTPAEAAVFKARALRMMRINERIQHFGWSQAEAAKHLRLTRLRTRELIAGRIDRFSIEDLIAIALPLGIEEE